jgi:adenylylsulfate kinase
MDIIWLFGQTGSGKTHLANLLVDNMVWLDGDKLRGVWKDLGLSKEDRIEQNWRIARLANMFHSDGHNVVVSTICPYKKQREEISNIMPVRWIYVCGGHKIDKEHPFEKP